MKKEKFTQLILDFFSIPGFAIQFIDNICFPLKLFFLVFSAVCFIILMVLTFYDKKRISRKRLIKKGKKILNNTHQKVVLFGGDLSWKQDYLEDIINLLKGAKIVEIIIPKEKLQTSNKLARKKIMNDIKEFKSFGADIYVIDTDLNMRGFIVDPESNFANIKTHMLFAKKISTITKNENRNKYSFQELNSEKDREIFAIIYNLYKQLITSAIKF